MKKVLFFVIIMFIVMSLISCREITDTTETADTVKSGSADKPIDETQPFTMLIDEDSAAVLNSQRQMLIDISMEGDVNSPMFISYLGKLEGDINEELALHLLSYKAFENYPYLAFLQDDHIIDAGGAELYLIVPLSDDATVTVNRWLCDESNDFTGENGEILYKSEYGDPILLRCNESDIVQNASVTVVQSGAEDVIDYIPRLSLYDGNVETDGYIQNLTNNILPFGDWKGQYMLESGALYDVTFVIRPDNRMYYSFQYLPESELYCCNMYHGTWNPAYAEFGTDSITVFDCSLQLISGEEDAPETIKCTLYMEGSSTWSYLYYLAGDELIAGQSESFTYGEEFIGLSPLYEIDYENQ